MPIEMVFSKLMELIKEAHDDELRILTNPAAIEAIGKYKYHLGRMLAFEDVWRVLLPEARAAAERENER